MPAHVRVSGVWRKTLASVRVAGAWRSVPQIYVKIGGAWRALYSYAWSLGGWGGCSASCGGGTQTRSVTCARNDGVTVDDAVCLKLVGAKPATSQPCNTQSCISCRYNASTDRVQYRYLTYSENKPCYDFILNGVFITKDGSCGSICNATDVFPFPSNPDQSDRMGTTSTTCKGYSIGSYMDELSLWKRYQICGPF